MLRLATTYELYIIYLSMYGYCTFTSTCTYMHGILSSEKIWVLKRNVHVLAHKHHQPELTNLEDRLCSGRRTIYIFAKRSILEYADAMHAVMRRRQLSVVASKNFFTSSATSGPKVASKLQRLQES